jgi:hypothetical protein
MRLPRPHLFFCLLVLAAAITLACGSSPHVLQSVSVNPATADAQNFPNGLVPFTATGIFNTAPTPVTPLTVQWGVCVMTAGSTQPTNAVAVGGDGVAQCASGAPGTYTVWAASSTNVKGGVCTAVLNPCSGGCRTITGTAQITCP